MKRVAMWGVVVAVIVLAWYFVVVPFRRASAEADFCNEVRKYLVDVEPVITECTFDWVNTDQERGFTREGEHNRSRLIERLSCLRSGGYVQFSSIERDSWRRLHRDILDELVWCARARAEKELGKDRNAVDFETSKKYLPSGWEKHFEVELLHSKLDGVWIVYPGNNLGERRKEFTEARARLDELMDELKIKKQ
ncbi:MAG: hypothetical protein PHI23_01555 [Candidatus Peribacteraceae bacterium]|nr:hypothetical protein [Candidatus Peribacteraceae bacterium]